MKPDFLRNFPFGIFLGVLASTVVFLVLDDSYGADWAKYFTYGVTAILSLFAAGISLFGVYISIEHQQKLERERRRGSLAAARTTLPLALDKLVSLAITGARNCLQRDAQYRTYGEVADALELDSDLILVLSKAIEYADPISSEKLSNLVRRQQVLLARLRSWDDPGLIGTDVLRVHDAVNWAVQHVLVGDAFAYARGHEAEIPSKKTTDRLDGVFHFRVSATPIPEEVTNHIAKLKDVDDPDAGFWEQ